MSHPTEAIKEMLDEQSAALKQAFTELSCRHSWWDVIEFGPSGRRIRIKECQHCGRLRKIFCDAGEAKSA